MDDNAPVAEAAENPLTPAEMILAGLRPEDVKHITRAEADALKENFATGGVIPPAGPIKASPIEYLLGRPWAIMPEALVEISARLARHAELDAPALEAAEAARPNRTAQRVTPQGGGQIAVIPLRGSITPRGSLFSLLFGLGGGLQSFRGAFREAMADPDVSAIVLDIDSPGGVIDLVDETAAEIRQGRGNGKRIVAISNTLCASAAYWIASAADEVVVTPSGQVGSIGVFCVHEDISRLESAMGVTTTIISAGQFKTEGNPYEPLSKAAKAAMQQQVDSLYGMFTAAIAAGRKVSQQAVQAGFGKGRCVLASDALRLGMVDRVATFEETIARLGGMAQDPAGNPADLLDDDDFDASTDAPELSAEADTTTSPDEGEEPHEAAPITQVEGFKVRDHLSGPLREQGWL